NIPLSILYSLFSILYSLFSTTLFSAHQINLHFAQIKKSSPKTGFRIIHENLTYD
ncbi:hypothetical protein VIS19158_02180, partial [Vibrio scophthalmi LMG 19158]